MIATLTMRLSLVLVTWQMSGQLHAVMKDTQNGYGYLVVQIEDKMSPATTRFRHVKATQARHDVIALPAARMCSLLQKLFDRVNDSLKICTRLAGPKVAGCPGGDP